MRPGPALLSGVGVMLATALMTVPGAGAAGSVTTGSGAPRTTVSSELESVACVSPSSCTAVGYGGSTVFDEVPLADRWNGTAWTAMSPSTATEEPANSLYTVSCVSASYCWALGSSLSAEEDASSLAELWNGHKWEVARTGVAQSNEAGFSAVACVNDEECWAVGAHTNSAGYHVPYAALWTETRKGPRWTASKMPGPSGVTSGAMQAVACKNRRNCTAVGSYKNSHGVSVTLADHFNGKHWRVTATPNPTGAVGSYLYGVACTSRASCTAVGYYQTAELNYAMLAEHWNGTSWVIVATPSPAGAINSSLNAVACSSAKSCIAVGDQGSAAGLGTLAEHWNGKHWKPVRSPNPSGSTGTLFTGVSCPSATSCSAVGYSEGSAGDLTLGEQWDGHTWRIVATPNAQS